MNPHELSQFIKAEAKSLGFMVCGIAKACDVPPEESAKITGWVEKGLHGEMSYLERNAEKRCSPEALVPGCKSIVCVALNYAQTPPDENRLHIARYAQGHDYHKIVKDRLHLLLQRINSLQAVKGRPFCDSAPVMERFWAVKAGLGWIGRNHQLIIPRQGSYFFLGELFLDCELEYDEPCTANHCGSCRKCIDSCPTGALTASGFDARKCLSYLTIEYHGELPENIGEKMGNCFYGCDRCTAACPWNNFATPCTTRELQASDELSRMSDKEWYTLTEERYNKLFSRSAVERAGYELLRRNIDAIKKCRD